MNTPESLNNVVSEMIRRGLPADYATRAAAEFSDHHRDLVEELQASGISESQAMAEASHRLGNAHILAKKIVREYQRRFWCGRWRLLAFLFLPLPAAMAAWFATGLTVWLAVTALTWLGLTEINDPDIAFRALPMGVKYAVLVAIFLVIPASVLYFFACLAKRAALSSKWVILAACVLGLSAGACKWERIGPGSKIVMRDRTTLQAIEQPKEPDFVLMLWAPINRQALSWREVHGFFLSGPVQSCQLLLPVAVAAMILRRRQLALRRRMARHLKLLASGLSRGCDRLSIPLDFAARKRLASTIFTAAVPVLGVARLATLQRLAQTFGPLFESPLASCWVTGI